MAILNIKSFPDKLYKKLQSKAKRERRSLTQEVICLLDQAVSEPSYLSILDLQGLGKEIWRDIDADFYVNGQRRQWE